MTVWQPSIIAACSDDGLVYTFKLRRGVPFHHGKELTAADAVASLLRWGKITPGGKRLFQRVESVKALNHYTIQLRLQQQTALVLPLLGGAAIYPKEVLEEAGEGQVRTHIGTGPFNPADLQPGGIKLVRLEQYETHAEPPNGYGGWNAWGYNPCWMSTAALAKSLLPVVSSVPSPPLAFLRKDRL